MNELVQLFIFEIDCTLTSAHKISHKETTTPASQYKRSHEYYYYSSTTQGTESDVERNAAHVDALFQFLCDPNATIDSFPKRLKKKPKPLTTKVGLIEDEHRARREAHLRLLGVPISNTTTKALETTTKLKHNDSSRRQATFKDPWKRNKPSIKSQATTTTVSRAPVPASSKSIDNFQQSHRRQALVQFLCHPEMSDVPPFVYPLLWDFVLDANGTDTATASSLLLVCKSSYQSFQHHPAASRVVVAMSKNKSRFHLRLSSMLPIKYVALVLVGSLVCLKYPPVVLAVSFCMWFVAVSRVVWQACRVLPSAIHKSI